jgi:hypothetical protein
LVKLVTDSQLSGDVCGSDELGHPLFTTSDYREPAKERVYHTTVLTAAGDTVLRLDDRRLIASTPRGNAGHELLLWHPETWVEGASDRGRADTVALFRHNYQTERNLSEPHLLPTALAMASRGESLSVYSRLIVADMSGETQSSFSLDTRYTPCAGRPFEAAGERLVLADTDIGYPNTDVLAMLLEQPELVDGEAVIVRPSDDIEGSYRGACLIAPDRGEVLWYRRLGVMCLRQHVVDLDGDGVDEILMETYGAENDVSGSGTTDAGCAYVLCLDQGGNILWRYRVLGVYVGTQAAAVDIADEEGLEVVVTWSSGYDERTGGAAVLNAGGRVLAARTDLGGLYGLTVADVDGDAELEIVTGGPDRAIYLLDSELELLTSAMSSVNLSPSRDSADQTSRDVATGGEVRWRGRVIPLGATDLSGDGVCEIVALETAWSRWDDNPAGATLRCGRGDLVVYDGSLRELMRAERTSGASGTDKYPCDMPACMKIELMPIDLDADGADELSLWMRTGGVYVYGRMHDG